MRFRYVMSPIIALLVGTLTTARQAAAQQTATQQPETGKYILMQAGTEIGTERYSRTASALEGELRMINGQRVAYNAKLSAGAVSEVVLRAFLATDTTKPAQTATFRFLGDSLTLETIRDGQPVRTSMAAPKGTVPFLNPSIVWMLEMVRKAKASGTGTVTVPIALLSAPQQIAEVTVKFASPTQATLTLDDTDINFTFDADGRLVQATVPSQQIIITRG